ncbi:MAG: complex I subunit 5 family protein [bacterium]
MNADAAWLESAWVWAVAPGLPLALAAMGLVEGLRTAVARLAWIGALPLLVLALFAPNDSGASFDALLFGSALQIDETGRPFALLTALVWILASLYAPAYLARHRESTASSRPAGRSRYFGFHLVTLSGNVGVTLAGDAATFYLFFALMTFASYGLIVHEGSDAARRAGFVYLVLAIFGEALLAAGIMIAMATPGSMRFDTLSTLAASPHADLGIGLLLGGLGVKAGMAPLHVWLPLAHPAAPTPASALLSGSIIAAGLLGWLRLLPVGVGIGVGPEWSELCVGLGLAAALGGAVLGTLQRDPKVLLAYSSISQMGWMTIGLGAALASDSGGSSPAVLSIGFFALHHGLAKAALFLSIGVAEQTPAHGIRRRILRLGIVLPALVIVGAPGTSGALAKSRLDTVVGALPGSLQSLQWIEPGLVLGVVGTAALMARFVAMLWTPRDPSAPASERHDGGAPGLWLPWWASIGLSLGIGPLVDALLPGLFEWLEPWAAPKISVDKLAPIAVGAVLVLGASRTRVAGLRPPAGGLLWLIEPGLRAARRGGRALVASATASLAGAIVSVRDEGRAASTPSRCLGRIEALLEPWTVLAVLMLVSASLLIVRSLVR